MKGTIAGLMQQAQKMQEKVQQAQEELGNIEVHGEAGAGLVKVLMSGRHEVRRVSIDRQLMIDDPEMAEDLVAAATNDAINKVAELSQQQMSDMTGGLQLPPGFKLPF
jgi:DNA-binding YbaB/EbfC family protein